jgi:hypothetical protein
MASLAAITLHWRGTALDRLWALNPTAYKQLAPLSRLVGVLFLAIGAALFTGKNRMVPTPPLGMETRGCNHRAQVLGDVVNCVRGDWLRGGIGVVIASTLLLFLLQPRIRATFA